MRKEWLGRSLDEVRRLDSALYRAVARTRTPFLDAALSRLSRAADYSRLSLAAAGVLALALVGYSRIHTGVHYPLDVVSGALCGIALAELTNAYADRLTAYQSQGVSVPTSASSSR